MFLSMYFFPIFFFTVVFKSKNSNCLEEIAEILETQGKMIWLDCQNVCLPTVPKSDESKCGIIACTVFLIQDSEAYNRLFSCKLMQC